MEPINGNDNGNEITITQETADKLVSAMGATSYSEAFETTEKAIELIFGSNSPTD